MLPMHRSGTVLESKEMGRTKSFPRVEMEQLPTHIPNPGA